MDMRVLGSGSKGNAYIIYAGEEVLLIECGVQIKKIMYGLNFNVSNVAGCLVSHEHKDHSKSMNEVMRAGIDVYASTGTIEASGAKKTHRLHAIQSEKQFQIGGFTVMPFSTEHDAAEPLGFLVYHKEIGKLLFATDTYYIRYNFSGLNNIMVECNYSKPILEKNFSDGKLNSTRRNRLMTSHFSLENVISFLIATDLKEVEGIFLMHLSDSNSDAEGFKNRLQGLFGIPVTVLDTDR